MDKFYASACRVSILIGMILCITTVYAQHGVLDVSFGNGGKVISGDSSVYGAYATVLQPDGKLVVVGGAVNPSRLAQRYNSDGSVDPTFILGQVTATPVTMALNCVALQPDGKIIAAGSFRDTSLINPAVNEDYFLVTRLNANGSYDTTFGNKGIVLTNLDTLSEYGFRKVFVKANGKIVAGGNFDSDPINGINVDFAIFQYNPDGSVDSSFGTNGKIIKQHEYPSSTVGDNFWNSFKLLKNEKLLIAGHENFSYPVYSNVLSLFEYDINGVIDTTFGMKGKVVDSTNLYVTYFHDIDASPNGNIMVLGHIENMQGYFPLIVNFDSTGKLNYNYGDSGKVVVPTYHVSENESIKILSDNKMLVAGYQDNSFFVFKLQENGDLDSSFGKHGVIMTPMNASNLIYGGLLVQPDGKIVISGGEYPYKGFVLIRYETNAKLYYNTIEGSTFVDRNINNIQDANEPYFSDANFIVTKPGLDTIIATALNGRFSLDIDTGSYSSAVTPYLPYYNTVPAFHNTSFTSYFNTDSISFALQPIPGKRDVEVTLIATEVARPGFPFYYKIYYKNKGTDTITSGTIKLVKNSKLKYTSATAVPASNVVDTLKWNFSNLEPLADSVITVKFSIKPPPVTSLGDTITSMINVVTDKADLTPNDNNLTVHDVVRSAFDPNDKTENHGGSITTTQVANGTYLTYAIRFQNTGNDTAFNIFIRDTLSAKLDWSTFQMITASHDYQTVINNGNQCLWSFNKINLLDSNHNKLASHGYLVYRIKPKPSVQLGDIIKNTAAIYFDYNLPVLTNTEKTTIVNDVLPLHLLSFTARKENKTNLLNWTTAQEINVDHFDIERSANSREFKKIGTVKAGLTNYSFTDNSPLTTINYYRLKMVDKDGKFEYSPVRLLNNNSDIQTSIYPNPAKETVTVNHPAANAPTQLQLTDMTGRILRRAIVNANAVQSTINVKGLPPGTYNLTWNNGAQSYTQVLVIE